MNENTSDTMAWFSSLIDDSAGVIVQLKDHLPAIQTVAQTISDALLSGHKLLTAGNGGSAAEALHLAEELVGRYSRPDRRALPAICLASDATTITCIANDWDFSSVFFRQVEALACARRCVGGFFHQRQQRKSHPRMYCHASSGRQNHWHFR